jgi:hypothetical protein
LNSIKRELHKPFPNLFFNAKKDIDTGRLDNVSTVTIEATSDAREGKRKGALPRLSYKGAQRPIVGQIESRWAYDSPRFRRRFESGKAKVDMDHAFRNFRDWLSVDTELTFENRESGETISWTGTKRGNRQFAIKKWRKVKLINEGMNGLNFDFEIPHHRSILRKCHLFLITLTFKQDISMERAWFLISAKGGEQNLFKSNLTKIFGSKATITTKEAQSNGYPAPHILVLSDRPIKVVHHHGKNGSSWRIDEGEILDRIKRAWPWGFVDVEAVVSSNGKKYRGYQTPINYLTKYITKNLDVTDYPEMKSAMTIEEIPKKHRTPIFTHIWNKILRSRDFYVSRAFKDRLNSPVFRPKELDSGTATDCSPWRLISCEASPNFHIVVKQKEEKWNGDNQNKLST